MADTKTARPGRNQPCHCGSGKKYKHCCLAKDEASDREARAQAQAEAPPVAPEPESAERRRAPRPKTSQPWKRGAQNTKGFQKRGSGPRKVGSG